MRFVSALPVVVAFLVPQNAQTRPTFTGLEELRLDAEQEDLSAVSRVLVNGANHFFVLQHQDFNIVGYTADGKRIFVAGRKGGGPAEFGDLSVGAAGFVHDTLWVYDQSLRRFSFVAPNGRITRTVPLPGRLHDPDRKSALGKRILLHFRPTAMLASGDIIGETRYGVASRKAPTTKQAPSTTVVQRVDRDGAIRQTLAELPADESSVGVQNDKGSLGTSVPFLVPPLRAYAPAGGDVVIVTKSSFSGPLNTITLVRISASGDTAFSRSLRLPALPVSKSSADSAISARIRSLGSPWGAELKRDLERAMRERIPVYYPTVVSVIMGADNTVWIELRRTGATTPWLILDESGNEIGVVGIAATARLARATKTHFVTIESDSSGSQSIARYRLVAARK